MIRQDELEWLQSERNNAIRRLDRGGDFIENTVRELFATQQRLSSTDEPVKLPLTQIMSHVRLKWRKVRHVGVAPAMVTRMPSSSHIGAVLGRICTFDALLLALIPSNPTNPTDPTYPPTSDVRSRQPSE